MSLIRIAIAGGCAVLALGAGVAFAAPAIMSHDTEGSLVAATAQSCAGGTTTDRDARGDCVSKAAGSSARSGAPASHASATGAAQGSSGSTDRDQHGDAVSAAAHQCGHGTPGDRDAHGDCVSTVARSNGR